MEAKKKAKTSMNKGNNYWDNTRGHDRSKGRRIINVIHIIIQSKRLK